MGKVRLLIFICILIGILAACNTMKDKQPAMDEETKVFIGEIEEIYEQNAIVTITEGDILASGQKASVNLAVAQNTEFEVGDIIMVGYDGRVMEKHPLGVFTIFVEIIEEAEQRR